MVGYILMFPTLFSIGSLPVSSFGVFLALGFLFGVFLVWRLSRAWDLPEERILDLTLLTFLGGLVGARLYFAIEHFSFFASNLFNLILVAKYPGFSFWGAFLGGWLTLYFFSRRNKIDFWQAADIASVGLLGGLIFSDMGCFLGGCSIGTQSQAFFAVPMVGQVGKRIPIQVFEAILLTLVLFKIWSQAAHFHLRGKIVSLALISIGLTKLITEPFRQVHFGGFIFSLTLIILGMTIFYKVQGEKRTPISDLRFLGLFFWKIMTDGESRKTVMTTLGKSWYNQKTALIWKLRNLGKMLRRIRVKPIPKNITNY